MGVHPPFRQKDGRTAARPLRSECRRHSDMAHTAFIFEGLKAFALHSQVRSFGHSQTRWNRSRSRDRLHPSEDAESLAVPSCRDQCRIASGCKGCLQHAPPPPGKTLDTANLYTFLACQHWDAACDIVPACWGSPKKAVLATHRLL